MTDEQVRQLTAGLTEEQRGYEIRLLAAEEAGDIVKVAALKDRIGQVDRQLKALTPKKPKVTKPAKEAAAAALGGEDE